MRQFIRGDLMNSRIHLSLKMIMATKPVTGGAVVTHVMARLRKPARDSELPLSDRLVPRPPSRLPADHFGSNASAQLTDLKDTTSKPPSIVE
jgi:hypothetical protein